MPHPGALRGNTLVLAHKVARITINGTMFGGLEQWSTGFYMGHEGSDAGPVTESFLSFVNDSWKVHFNLATNDWSNSYDVRSIRGAIINVDGKTDAASIKNFYLTTPYTGGSGSRIYPPQIALVATLQNTSPRGIGSKGRMYLPGVNATVGADGHIAGTAPQQIATQLKTFFDKLNGVFDAPGQVINASKGSKASGFTDGVNKAVRSVKVGNVYDTQRRRRNQLVEVYSSAALV